MLKEKKLTRVEINLDAIAYNVKKICDKVGPGVKVMAVVKADGYGHGAVEVAKVALKNGAIYLAVGEVEEGVKLRLAGIKAPILVLGPALPENAEDILKYDLTQTVCTKELAQALSFKAQEFKKEAKVHVKIDTGLGRIGVFPGEACRFIKNILDFKGIKIEGIFTHLAEANKEDKSFSIEQIEKFKKVIFELEEEGIKIPLKHVANSAAVLDLPFSHFNMVRPGIIIYGLYPSKSMSPRQEFKPAMSFKTSIVYIKKVPAGTYLSYERSFITKKKSTIAILPVGYADGFSRALSNRGEVLIKGKRAPVVGRVCMDMTLVDVSHIQEVKVGDEVVLFGRQSDEFISVDEVASKAGTINYEVICTVGSKVPRVYLGKEKKEPSKDLPERVLSENIP